MKFSGIQKKYISIVLMLFICISGIWSGSGRADASFSADKKVLVSASSEGNLPDTSCHHQDGDRISSTKYVFPANSDYRVKNAKLKNLQQIDQMKRNRRGDGGRNILTYFTGEEPLSKYCTKITKTCCRSIRLISYCQNVIISYIHHQDGAKG